MLPKYTVFCLASAFYFTFSACTQGDKTPATSAAPTGIKPEVVANVISEQSNADTLKGSLKSEASGRVGSANVKISYHSPAVRGRVVWGGLVPYNQVWVTGAHSATTLETDQELTIQGKKLASGKYALFTIPGKNEWILIINKNWKQHLTDNYSEKDDVMRVSLKAENMPQNQERLRYQIIAGSTDNGEITLSWDKLKVSLPIKQ